MKKRFLSLLLALVMVLTCTPLASAVQSGFAPAAQNDTTGPVDLMAGADTELEKVESGYAPIEKNSGLAVETPVEDDGSKYAQYENQPFSQENEAVIKGDEEVTFIVVLDKQPQLEKYPAGDVTAQSEQVTAYRDTQLNALANIQKRLPNVVRGGYEIGYTYTVLTTAFSVKTAYENKAALEGMSGVKAVYVAPTYSLPVEEVEPLTSNAPGMIGADILNGSGYTGTGMKIAIIDTGIVVDHPNFQPLPEEKLTENSATRESIEEVWNQLNASESGKLNHSYVSTKIPYAFNYVTMDFDVSHATAGHDHGTHVAGIAAANKIESSEVVGIAPDAQLFVMQTFGATGAGWDVIMAAMEDCVVLGVDAVNLSLGSDAGFVDSDADAEMLAVMENFKTTDIQVLIASGNSTNSAYMNLTGMNMSYTSDPDTGLTSTPGTFTAAISVASANNDGAKQLYFTVNGQKIGYNDSAASSATRLLSNFQGQTLEFVVVPGYGTDQDYEGLDVDGKVAVVSRGVISFPEKQANAQTQGAIACVVYNNAPGFLNMQINDGEGNIPCVCITRTDGEFLVGLGSGELTVCDGDLGSFKYDKSMSDFSSWGVTPDLKLKPEITGVGGEIYSTRDPSIAGSSYGEMSGTSMATPQITGAMAVLTEYLEKNTDFRGEALRQTAANLAMSTAAPILENEVPYSPRNQGAGLIDLVGATNSGVYLSNPATSEGRPKADLGDDPEKTGRYEFVLQAVNFSDEDKTYTLDYDLMAPGIQYDVFMSNSDVALEGTVSVGNEYLCYDFNDDGRITTADARVLLRYLKGTETIAEKHLAYVDVNGDGAADSADVKVITDYCAELSVAVDAEAMALETVQTVTVPAGETVELKAVIDVADTAYLDRFENGTYVEGYLYLNAVSDDEGDAGSDLVMPFLGFYGDWSAAPVFDGPTEENPDKPYSLFEKNIYTYYSVLGSNPYIRSGASGDEYNTFSYSNPLAEIDIGLLRNAKYLTFTVTDAETGETYWSEGYMDVVKTYYNTNYGMILPLYMMIEYGEIWNGLDAEGNRLPDGTEVIYTLDACVDDGDEVADDSFSFRMTLDDAAPEILNADDLQSALSVDENNHLILSLELQDNGHIAAVLFLAEDGTIMGKYAVDNEPGVAATYNYDITGFGDAFTIVVGDYAVNETEIEASLDLTAYNGLTPGITKLDSDRLYGNETFDGAAVESGWFSVNKADFSDVRNETSNTSGIYYSAEFVNGYVVAQSALTGNLELLTPTNTYWKAQTLAENRGAVGEYGVWVLYDMALRYDAEGSDRLFATGWYYQGDQDGDGRDDGYNALFEINFTEYGDVYVQSVGRFTGMDGEMLTLGCTTEGQLYGIDTTGKLYKISHEPVWDDSIGNWGDYAIACEYVGTTDFVNVDNYSGCNVIQSMGYDHNTGTMYWYAHSQTPSGYTYINTNITYTVDLETAQCTEVGTYGPGGQTGLFVPHDMESDLFTMGVEATNMSLTPDNLKLVKGQTKRLSIVWRPWNAEPEELTWESSDESVVIVDGSGKLTAVGPGTATVSASAEMLLDGYWDIVDGNWIWHDPEMGTRTVSCTVTVVDSQDEIYGFAVEDFATAEADMTWYTYADSALRDVTDLGGQTITCYNALEDVHYETDAMWQGGAYYNGYVYTVVTDQGLDETGAFGGVTALYRMKINRGETPAQTTFGEPERIGEAFGVELGNLGFDYNTGRMYAVDYTNGGLGIVDLDTGAFDSMGTFSGDIGGAAIAPAMCVTADGTIVIADMFGNVYTVDPETLRTTNIGYTSEQGWYYAAMTYDYNTGNIYWNPCQGSGEAPLYVIQLTTDEWSGQKRAEFIKLSGVSTKYGTEQTVLFTIPENEPETSYIPTESIKIANGDMAGLVDARIQLNAVTTPARPTVQAKTWTSSDESVVTVDRLGMMTLVGVGEAEVTVSISNKNPEDGGPFTDTIKVTVLEAAGRFEAFLNDDEGGTDYYDFWMSFNDYDLRNAQVGQSMINVYSLRTGAYYDGFYYAYNDQGDFLRIDPADPSAYVTLGALNLDLNAYQVTGMAFDYTTGTMYGLTLTSNYDYSSWSSVERPGSLVTIDLNTGAVTEVAKLSMDKRVYALACDLEGTLYAVGSNSFYDDYATLYTLDKETAAYTEVMTIDGAVVHTGATYYSNVQYNSQMTYDIGTNRLYLNATVDDQNWQSYSGMFMIQLGDEPVASRLGGISLNLRAGSSVKEGNVYLGLLASIPEEDEVPVGTVNGIMLNKTMGRMALDGTTQLTAQVRPGNALDTSVTWSSDDESIATVDDNGLVTGVSEGTVTIRVTSNENPDVVSTCTITVMDVSGEQSVAYTVSANREALIKFNPALPAQTAEEVVTLSGGSSICGMAATEDFLLYAVEGIPYPTLYRYDYITQQSVSLGQLECWTGCDDLAYDESTGIVYIVGGFYIYQFIYANLSASNGINYMAGYMMDSDYATLAGITTKDGMVYYLGNDSYSGGVKLIRVDQYLSNRQVLVTGLGINVVKGKSEMAYDALTDLIYVTDGGNRLYTTDFSGNVTQVDILGDGIDLNGLAIVAPAE